MRVDSTKYPSWAYLITSWEHIVSHLSYSNLSITIYPVILIFSLAWVWTLPYNIISLTPNPLQNNLLLVFTIILLLIIHCILYVLIGYLVLMKKWILGRSCYYLNILASWQITWQFYDISSADWTNLELLEPFSQTLFMKNMLTIRDLMQSFTLFKLFQAYSTFMVFMDVLGIFNLV
jgi:hypothetical protein